MALRGPGALASSGASAGRAPVRGPARGAGPGLCGPWALIVTLVVLLPVLSASATANGQDRAHQQLTAPQALRRSPSTKWCPPGFYLSEYTGDCMSCRDGVDFTNYTNDLSACRLCSQCYPGEEQVRSCTRTADTVCQCKPGTYREGNSPELCRPCSSGCPEGKVITSNCSSQNDLQCVDQESSTQDSGKVPVPREPVTTSPGPPTAPSPSSGDLALKIGVPVGSLCLLMLVSCACRRRRRILQACGVDPKRVDRLFFWCSCPPRGPGARDNAHNQIVSSRNSQSTLDSEQELEQQEHAELTEVIALSPEEAKRLLGPAGARRVSDEKQAAVSSNGVGPQ
ncbi:tumor necrosis factor receptor superfamily member 10B-like isoform X2 [Rousettus aegyptiacus]|uniref:tumor necrosis factor receptor superfamily member 10B-like isoform X2 n=1 Tax=Rousettus aegyptiacus TaxID=9407 RepID=UPI00168CCAC7|nr:tumor necrosis factor receptor superfamily member 10B-like isoform X2 [Rousettus aegyptiacus]XP_036089867.1 tumor necrosis factor receptor superfamily member 10B-like isoform X2 [Rousettus aegyptiacus]